MTPVVSGFIVLCCGVYTLGEAIRRHLRENGIVVDEHARFMWERDEARRFIQRHMGGDALDRHFAEVDGTTTPTLDESDPASLARVTAPPPIQSAGFCGQHSVYEVCRDCVPAANSGSSTRLIHGHLPIGAKVVHYGKCDACGSVPILGPEGPGR